MAAPARRKRNDPHVHGRKHGGMRNATDESIPWFRWRSRKRKEAGPGSVGVRGDGEWGDDSASRDRARYSSPVQRGSPVAKGGDRTGQPRPGVSVQVILGSGK